MDKVTQTASRLKELREQLVEIATELNQMDGNLVRAADDAFAIVIGLRHTNDSDSSKCSNWGYSRGRFLDIVSICTGHLSNAIKEVNQ